MPRPYPREFRDDVVWVARNRSDGVHPLTLHKWMRQRNHVLVHQIRPFVDDEVARVDRFQV